MYYILKGKLPVKCSLLEWSLWFGTTNRRVAFTEIGKCSVSTVFLGIDHQDVRGAPLLFETMVFDEAGLESEDDLMERYSTWEQAEAGHARVVAEVRRRRFKIINGDK